MEQGPRFSIATDGELRLGLWFFWRLGSMRKVSLTGHAIADDSRECSGIGIDDTAGTKGVVVLSLCGLVRSAT